MARAVSMMIGRLCVRSAPRSRLASETPDSPGSIQSRITRSGSSLRIAASASSTLEARTTWCPACCRLIASNSWICGSSSTTRMVAPISGAELRRVGVADVGALDDVNDIFGHVLRVVADALDGLGDPDDVERSADGARVFHHVGDELAQQRLELAGEAGVSPYYVPRSRHVEAREGVERAAQHGER